MVPERRARLETERMPDPVLYAVKCFREPRNQAPQSVRHRVQSVRGCVGGLPVGAPRQQHKGNDKPGQTPDADLKDTIER